MIVLLRVFQAGAACRSACRSTPTPPRASPPRSTVSSCTTGRVCSVDFVFFGAAAAVRLFVNAIGGQGVGQLGTWLQFHQVPRAASAAVAAGVVVSVLGDAATPEIVAGLIACRTEQILPAIEDYLYKQKGLARGDVD